MIYQMLNSAVVKSLDLAIAVLRKNADLDTVINTTGDAVTTGFCFNIVSDRRPSNVADSDRNIVSLGDFDVTEFVKTQQKTQKGHFFASVVTAGSAPANSLANVAQELRKICDNVQVMQLKFSGSTAIKYFAYGFLKVTQTIDYEPLTELNASLLTDYVQIDPADLGV